MIQYKVYVIYNRKHGKIYIGQTGNLEERLTPHNNHVFKGYTSNFDGEWIIIYSEDVSDGKSALLREKQLKSYKGSEFVKTLIPNKIQSSGVAQR